MQNPSVTYDLKEQRVKTEPGTELISCAHETTKTFRLHPEPLGNVPVLIWCQECGSLNTACLPALGQRGEGPYLNPDKWLAPGRRG